MFLYILGITLAIVGAVSGDFLVKQSTKSMQDANLKSFGGPVALLNPVKVFQFLKQLGIFHNWKLWLGISLMTIHFGGFILAMRVAPITMVVPMMASTHIIDTILAKTILHERVTLVRWAGVVIVVVGIIVLAKWGNYNLG